jgi:hypothetical protein
VLLAALRSVIISEASATEQLLMDNDKIRSLEERLAAADEALRLCEQRSVAGKLALELMHEIMNPLEALGHLLYLTSQQASDPEQVRQFTRWAEEQLATGWNRRADAGVRKILGCPSNDRSGRPGGSGIAHPSKADRLQ